MDVGKNSVYTEDELIILEKSKNIKIQLVDNLIKHSDPKDASYKSVARVTNEILSSLDKFINDTANTRVKHQDSENSKASAELVVAALMASKTKVPLPENRITELPDHITPGEIVPGHMDINPAQLSPSTFIDEQDG